MNTHTTYFKLKITRNRQRFVAQCSFTIVRDATEAARWRHEMAKALLRDSRHVWSDLETWQSFKVRMETDLKKDLEDVGLDVQNVTVNEPQKCRRWYATAAKVAIDLASVAGPIIALLNDLSVFF